MFISLYYLVKYQYLKAAIVNKTYVATNFKKLTTRNHVFIVSIIV